MKGIFYGVGIGPGDPELLTVKAIRLIGQCQVAAVPDSGAAESLAIRIAGAHLEGKEILFCPIPMTRDQEKILEGHRTSTALICEKLAAGMDVAYLTLGDPSIYASFRYLQKMVEAAGYATGMVPGITSFCAAAAALNTSLCENEEALHILPAAMDKLPQALSAPGTKVIMKSGKHLNNTLDVLRQKGMLAQAVLIEQCSTPQEMVYRSLEEASVDCGYISLLIVKEEI